jgi:sugar phosphate isomerase/epimerase
MELGVPCWSFGIEHLQGRLPFEGAAQIARALGFHNTAIGWSHLDWPKIRQDPVAAADDVRRVIEPLELEIDDSFVWFRNRYIDELVNELKCTLTQPDQSARDDNFEMLKSFTQFCVEIGCPGITLSSGIKYADQGFSFDEIYGIARDELRRMVDYAGEFGVEIRPEPHSESIMGTLATCQQMLEDVPGLKVSLDYSHFMPQGHSIEEVHALIPFAGHVHARQANRERLQCRQEEGILDFEAIVQELVKQDYKGNIALEYVCVNYRGCNDVDVITETLKLKKDLQEYLAKYDPTFVAA